MKIRVRFLLSAILLCSAGAAAHDGWIQSNAARVRRGEMVYVDMQFGNHGNMHRDYKIYPSKWDPGHATFILHTPGGQSVDLAPSVIDVGQDTTVKIEDHTYLDKNGYLVASFQATEAGAYIMDVRQDMVVSYAPERSIKCAKVIVDAGPAPLSRGRGPFPEYGRILGQILELVPLNDPSFLRVGDALKVKLIYKGLPLPNAPVSVIPRGKTLAPAPEMDRRYDLMTDGEGTITFQFDEANYHLIVAHVETNEAGFFDDHDYTSTKYAATLTVIVGPAD